jgi:hypothetical protein
MKTKIILGISVLLGTVMVIDSGCSKKDSNPPTSTVPKITTNTVTNITQTSAYCGGNITSDGGSEVTARGICWSTYANPLVSDYTSNEGTGTGGFGNMMTNLTPNTVYYVRAFAINSVGRSYGNEQTFKTLENLQASFSITYTTIPIGSQDGILFHAQCTNEDVIMTNVIIRNPTNTLNVTYNLNGNTYVKNQQFDLQDAGIAYVKELGEWKFTLNGKRATDEQIFSVVTTLNLTSK